MIQNKKDLKRYLYQDRKANQIPSNSIMWILKQCVSPNLIWRYIYTLRIVEYHKNSNNKLLYALYKYKLNLLGVKLGFSIPPNVFGPGLSIPHYGMIVINGNASIGANCRLMQGVTVGSTGGGKDAPCIGDNAFLGVNSVIIGKIKIADNVSIGANSVVKSSFDTKGVMIAGTPAVVKKDKCEIWWKLNSLEL